MPGPKPGALPLGDTPIINVRRNYNEFVCLCQERECANDKHKSTQYEEVKRVTYKDIY